MPSQSEFLQFEMDNMVNSTIEHQTLATGETKAQGWARVLAGDVPANQLYPLNKLFGMVIGPYGVGKSSLLQGNPDCFIINTDLTSTVIKPCRAVMWPHVGEDGQIVGDDGKPIILQFEAIQKKINQLVDLAKTNKPRPECIFIDSLPGLITILRDWICRSKNYKDWSEADDKTDGSRVYVIVAKIASDLRAAGYGFWYSCPLDYEIVQLTRESASKERKWGVSESALARFQYALQLVVPITITWVKEDIMVDGKKETRWRGDRYADFTDPQTAGAAKARNITGRILLPPNHGWEAFEAAYQKANI